MELITVDWIWSYGPCADYPRERIEQLIGAGKSRLEILDLEIPATGRIWVLSRPDAISLDQAREFAILCAYPYYTESNWRAWADNWLSGVDRSAAAAASTERNRQIEVLRVILRGEE